MLPQTDRRLHTVTQGSFIVCRAGVLDVVLHRTLSFGLKAYKPVLLYATSRCSNYSYSEIQSQQSQDIYISEVHSSNYFKGLTRAPTWIQTQTTP